MNSRSRKYQLTINNPFDYGYSHTKINEIMKEVKSIFYCLCDEIGEQGTTHTHIYFICENAMLFSTVQKLFPKAHIEKANGSSKENRDYIRKEGKHETSEKKETNLIDTFEEYGEMPLDKSAKNMKVSEQVLQMLEDDCSNVEIIKAFPSYTTKISQLESARQTLLEDKNKNCWRDIDTIYIYGETGTGKTRFVMDTFGYPNVYKVTNYDHPFDGYKGEKIILLDEFRSSLPFGDLLQYLDGYPCRLPARYSDRTACFTKAFIISNIPLDEQYRNIQAEQKDSWNSFIRRIKDIIKYEHNNDMPFSKEAIVQIHEFPNNYLR